MNNETLALLMIPMCAGPILVFVIIFAAIVIMRWLRHREILALVEKGMLPEQYVQQVAQPPKAGRGRALLGWGIGVAGLGLALMIGLYPIGFGPGPAFPLHFGPWMLGGLIPLFIGLALLITHFATRKE